MDGLDTGALQTTSQLVIQQMGSSGYYHWNFGFSPEEKCVAHVRRRVHMYLVAREVDCGRL